MQDELQHREAKAIARRLQQAKFEQEKTFEQIKLNCYPSETQKTMRELIGSQYLKSKQNVLIMGPAGTGKTHLAQALGHHACRQGLSVRFVRSNMFFRDLHASRADETWMRKFQQYNKHDLLILDDFGLKVMTPQQADDIYELIAERHQKCSIIMTSNRSLEGWIKLFPDPVMGNAALDRLANNSYQLILTGESYRKNLRPNTTE